jgi:uncharacterized membrane protein
VVLCLLAGLFARTRAAKSITGWIESTILSSLPGYSVIKSFSESLAGFESNSNQKVVLARIEDAWQIALMIERLDDGQVAVYVPGAPMPTSGSMYYMTEDRIRATDLSMSEAFKILRHLGAGSGAILAKKA